MTQIIPRCDICKDRAEDCITGKLYTLPVQSSDRDTATICFGCLEIVAAVARIVTVPLAERISKLESEKDALKREAYY